MVLQYKRKREKRWKKYSGKSKIKGAVSNYDFRLLNESKKKILTEGDYSKVLKRFRAIEFFNLCIPIIEFSSSKDDINISGY